MAVGRNRAGRMSTRRETPQHETYEALRAEIARRHPRFSDRLQVIAEFALDHPTEIALGTVAEVAQRAKVQPSAIVAICARARLWRLHRDAAGVPLASRGQRRAELQGAHRRAEARRPLPRYQRSARDPGAICLRGNGFARKPAGCGARTGPGPRHRPAWRRAYHLCAGAGRLVSGGDAPDLCAAQARASRGPAGRARQRAR